MEINKIPGRLLPFGHGICLAICHHAAKSGNYNNQLRFCALTAKKISTIVCDTLYTI